MRKKLVSLLMAAAVAGSMAGCSTGSSAKTTTAAQTTAAATTAAATTAAATTEEATTAAKTTAEETTEAKTTAEETTVEETAEERTAAEETNEAKTTEAETTVEETTEAKTTAEEADETTLAEGSAEEKEVKHFDSLTLEFVPSRDADVIIAGTANLPELVKAEMLNLGYDIDEVDISVGTSYDATGEAMAAGTIDVGWLPGGTYALYSDDVDVILTATRNGLSNDSTDPKTWNGDENATKKDGPQVTYYRSLIYATPSAYGKELAEKVNNGEELTWEDLDKANWAVQKTSSSAGYIYPTMWLMDNYDGKKISDLSNVITIDSGYGTAFSYAAAESVDIIVCYADGRNDYEASWQLATDKQDDTGKQGMGRSDSIWNELNVIGVTEGIYNDTVAVSKACEYYTPEMMEALQDCFINIINTEEGAEIFSVYSHTGYAKATDSDYDGARAALQAVAE